MDEHSRWTRVGVASLVVPLCALCALGVDGRYAAVTVANVVALVVLGAQLRHRCHRTRAAWLVMFAGVGALVMHNAANQVAVAATGVPASGVTSAVTLVLGYGLLLVGGVLATASSVREPGGVLDAAIVGLAVASVMWGAVLSPAHQRLGSSVTRMVYELSLVLVVTALTGVVARAAVVYREMRTAALYLLVAMVAADLSDVTLTLTEDPGPGCRPGGPACPASLRCSPSRSPCSTRRCERRHAPTGNRPGSRRPGWPSWVVRSPSARRSLRPASCSADRWT